MLVIKRRFQAWARRTAGSEERGAILVAVVVVMLVGFIIAATVAAAVMFTISANADNRSSTQAFIAAESGRDAVVSQIADGCASDSRMTASSASPEYVANAYPVASDGQISTTGLTPTCPTADTAYVLIESTGTGPSGDRTTIQSVYRWSASFSSVPGGVVTYFSGNVSQGVSHYTGDMVLRNGNWSCTVDGTLDGDLYVLSGTVSMSNNCTIKGDIWSAGAVSSNSTGWKVTANARTGAHGDITTNGYVSFNSNGDPAVAGSISAKGTVTLKDAGSGAGKVGGTVTSMVGATVDTPAWTTGTITQNTGAAPTFVPPLDWLLQATKWLDLNNTSGWGTITPGDCSKLQNSGTASPYVTGLVGAGTTPLVLDFTGCTKAMDIKLTSSAKLTRDVTIIVPPGQRMLVDLAGTLSDGAHQLFLVHSDASLTDVDADGFPKPTCGNGNQNDSFGTSAVVSSDLKVMVYSPCGLTGTVTASFSGQLYSNDTTNFHAGSSYTCATMSWPGALEKLGCTIKGDDGVGGDSVLVQKLGTRVVQREVPNP